MGKNLNFESIPTVKDNQAKIPSPSDLFDQGILFSGGQDPIAINETAIHSDFTHYSIGNGTDPQFDTKNTSFPLDQTHGWEGYRYSANLTNLVDERDWVENGNFGSDLQLSPSSKIVQYFNHTYEINEKKTTILDTFDGNGCDYMRLHFINMTVQGWYDTIFLWDQDTTEIDWYSGNYEDILTPWYAASQLKVSIDSDNFIHGHFYIDYFETYNGTLFPISNNSWTPYAHASDLSRMNASEGHQGNNSAIKVEMRNIEEFEWGEYTVELNDESGIYQEVSIPRGKVTDAWISMDYFLLRGVRTDDMYLFLKINDQIIYKRGFRTISEEGLAKWHKTGLVNINYWENQSNVFDQLVSGQTLNLSIGIQAGVAATFFNVDHVEFQEAYFDNISLIVQAEANCTQTEINLEFDGYSLTESPSEWGSGTINLSNTWTNDPIQISMTSDSLKIEFDLESIVYGFHLSDSFITPYGAQGSQVTVYTNSSVQWELYHNSFIPLFYSGYNFYGIKPLDWDIDTIEDPLGESISFSGGTRGDGIFNVMSQDAGIPGWWYIKATSTNMLQTSSTQLWNGTDWENYKNPVYYDVNDTLIIRTALNTTLGNIENNASTSADLKIFDPDNVLWYNESVTPTLSGEIQFPDLTIGGWNTTGGEYAYSITWTNGTSAGGLNGTFNVLRNINYTFLYPRDAIEDLTTEAILGDIVPLRLILNDSITGVRLSDLTGEYNWTSSTQYLTEVSQGIYDGSLDTEELTDPGYHEISITVGGPGYYNTSFTLQINLVGETELKIVGLDSNIDYGTNFSIRVKYSSKNPSYGIPGANLNLNMSSSFYTVTSEIEDGNYLINVSSKDAFPNSGSYDITINASKVFFETEEIVTRIRILPRTVYYNILLNSNDCTINKSYSTYIKQKVNFTIGIFSSAEHLPVTSGDLYLTDGTYISPTFSTIGDYYQLELNTSVFGLGVHFLSIVFNETDYQSAAETIQLTVARLSLGASLYNTNQTLLVDRNKNFTVQIYLEDPLTLLPISDAQISYSWIFGRGILTNLGNGFYLFEETSPKDIGTYQIVFTITSPNSDYDSEVITLTLVSQLTDVNPNLWWVLLIVGTIALITTVVLGIVTYKQKVLKPKQERELDLLRQKTQIFDDITIIKSILIIETGTGRLMYQQKFGGLQEDHEDIFSGFLHSILTLSNKFALKNGDLGDKQEYAEFTHEAFHVLVASGEKVIIALILEEESSQDLQKRAFKFLDEFEGIYSSILVRWNGDRSIFNDTTPKLFEEIFHLSLLNRFIISDAQNVEILEKKIIIPGTLSERVSQIIKTVSLERNDFLLRTLISLVPEEEQLGAKDIILRFIKNKYLIPVQDRNT